MGMGKMVLHLKLQYSKARETNWYTLCYSTVLGEKKTKHVLKATIHYSKKNNMIDFYKCMSHSVNM